MGAVNFQYLDMWMNEWVDGKPAIYKQIDARNDRGAKVMIDIGADPVLMGFEEVFLALAEKKMPVAFEALLSKVGGSRQFRLQLDQLFPRIVFDAWFHRAFPRVLPDIHPPRTFEEWGIDQMERDFSELGYSAELEDRHPQLKILRRLVERGSCRFYEPGGLDLVDFAKHAKSPILDHFIRQLVEKEGNVQNGSFYPETPTMTVQTLAPLFDAIRRSDTTSALNEIKKVDLRSSSLDLKKDGETLLEAAAKRGLIEVLIGLLDSTLVENSSLGAQRVGKIVLPLLLENHGGVKVGEFFSKLVISLKPSEDILPVFTQKITDLEASLSETKARYGE